MMERIRAIGTLALVGLVAAGCGEAGGTPLQESAEATVRTINVEVARIQPQEFTHFVQVVGTVEAERDITVAAEEGGVVRSIQAVKGERVAVGDVLVQIDDDVLRAQADQAQSQASLAEEQWQRQKRLWEQDSVGTEIQYLQAKYNAETTAAAARALRERLARKSVRAPIAGILDERMVEVGTMVAPGAPVARIVDMDTVKISAGIPERYAPDIERNARVRVMVNALSGRQYEGRVDFVGAAVDRDNRTFEVEVEVANPGLGIKPGMVADVQISRQTISDALVAPRHAVLRRENGYVVYVARQTGNGWQAEARSVELGVSRGDQVVVRSGLEPGERIVVVGQQQVADGDMLQVTNDTVASMETGSDQSTAGGEG